MARTKITPQPPAEMPEILPAKVASIEAAQEEHALALRQADSRVRAVAAQLGYQLPADCADPDLIQRDIAANMRRSVEACLEVGRGLRVLKEACGHGNFMARLEVLNIDVYVASRFMQSATKFSNLPSNANLTKAIGNQTKLFEMLVLDDEQIEELELTGQTGELHLDEIATMSVKELRAALRQSKQDNEFAGKQLHKERERADKAEKKLAGKRPVVVPLDERVGEFQSEINERQQLLEKLLLAHDEAVMALDAWWTEEVTSAPDYDPESPVDYPKPVLAVVRHLHDAVERTATMVGALQHRIDAQFGDAVSLSRQYLMQEPDHGTAAA